METIFKKKVQETLATCILELYFFFYGQLLSMQGCISGAAEGNFAPLVGSCPPPLHFAQFVPPSNNFCISTDTLILYIDTHTVWVE